MLNRHTHTAPATRDTTCIATHGLRWRRVRRFNAAKVGFYFGVVIDALKLAG